MGRIVMRSAALRTQLQIYIRAGGENRRQILPHDMTTSATCGCKTGSVDVSPAAAGPWSSSLLFISRTQLGEAEPLVFGFLRLGHEVTTARL